MQSISYLLSVVIVIARSSVFSGQQQFKTDEIEIERDESNTALQRATRELGEWKIVMKNEEHTTAVCDTSSLLLWSWSDNGRLYRNVSVYSAEGRPVAVVEFFSWFTPIEGDYFQCTSLTDFPLTATRSGVEIWRPRSSSVEMIWTYRPLHMTALTVELEYDGMKVWQENGQPPNEVSTWGYYFSFREASIK